MRLFRRNSMTLAALCVVSTASQAEETDSPSDPPTSKSVALSVGTGPQPLDTLTLGLLGLGGRVILVNDKRFDPVIGFSHTSGGVSDFPESGFSDRTFTRLGTTTGFIGLKGGTPPKDDSGVLAYGIGGAMLTKQGIATGQQGDAFHTGGLGIGVLGGFGLDAFLGKGISAGAELGGLGFTYFGSSRFDGTVEGRVTGLALSSYASVQVTVWK